MKLIILAFITFASTLAFASKADFLKKIEKGEGLTQSSMLDGFPATIVAKVASDYKREFPNFKENMLFVYQWDDGSVIHAVKYHFDDRVCMYTKIVKSQIGSNGLPSSLSESINESRGIKLVKDENLEKIDVKYCKMLYSF